MADPGVGDVNVTPAGVAFPGVSGVPDEPPFDVAGGGATPDDGVPVPVKRVTPSGTRRPTPRSTSTTPRIPIAVRGTLGILGIVVPPCTERFPPMSATSRKTAPTIKTIAPFDNLLSPQRAPAGEDQASSRR